MKEIKDATILVVDHGLGLSVAHRLSKAFKRVLYHTPFENGFIRLNSCIIGDGYENIERCEDPWAMKSEIDGYCFPDIYHAGWQLELESQGYPVWGARRADRLEMNRERFQTILGDIGLRQAPFEKVIGITNLRAFLKDKKNKFIKISKFRGSFETCHWRSWNEDRCNIDSWAVEFGPAEDLIPFLVFDPIGNDLEIGGDTYTVDGEWPSLMLRGDEYKDKSYLSVVTPRSEMPAPIQEVLMAFALVLKPLRCRSKWSMELRGQGDEWYFIDPTPRLGLPSTASQCSTWNNFPEIVWAGAHGELIEPEPNGKFTAEVALTMRGEKGAWKSTTVPEELRDVMMLSGCCEIDGMACFPPDDQHEEHIGWLVAVGDTMKETIDTLKGYAAKLPDGVSAKTDTLVNLLAEIHEAKSEGIEFGTGQEIPKPSSVVEDA